jgi:hypothetical protein
MKSSRNPAYPLILHLNVIACLPKQEPLCRVAHNLRGTCAGMRAKMCIHVHASVVPTRADRESEKDENRHNELFEPHSCHLRTLSFHEFALRAETWSFSLIAVR